MPSWPALHRALSTLLLVGATQVLPLEANEPIPAPGTLMELQDVQYSALSDWNSQYQAQCLKELGRQAGAFSALTPGAVFLGLIQANVTRLVPSMGLQYASVDSHGHPRRYSGRLFLPHHAAGSPPMRLPLVIYQHGTELRRSFTPYRNGGDETMLGALGAQAAGLAVAMPDGDGMGMDPSPERHAYCQAQTTARCLLDMVRAITSNQERIFDGINYVWDGRLFLLGYSEGGYIALAAVKALTTDPDWQDLWLTGAACMGGPFNLPVMMRTLLQDRSHTYTRPYLPAYFLATWEGLYPGVFTFQDAMNPLLLAPEPSRPGNPDQGSIQAWVAGVLGGKTITPRIQARLTGDPMQEVAAREVLNESWARTHVDPPETVLNQLLEANSLVGGWGPKVPVLLAHDPLDECVPFINSQTLFEAWVRMGLRPRGILPLALGGRNAGHVGGALLSVPTAFTWIAAGMPASLMELAAGALKQKMGAALPPAAAQALSQAATLATQAQNVNRPEFPLSRIQFLPEGAAGPWILSLADPGSLTGKVKVYTLAPFPQFPGQEALPGCQGYPKFLTQLKHPGDHLELRPDEPYFIALYPTHGTVALTLGFQGMDASGPIQAKVRIKQVKHKWLGAGQASFEGDPGFRQACLHEAGFEHPASPLPFVTVPMPRWIH